MSTRGTDPYEALPVGARIRWHGKFEGEARYAPYCYEWFLNGFAEPGETEGRLISFIHVDEEILARFPELAGKDEVAFIEADNGFWCEIDAVEARKAIEDETPF
jgi:hypothetical protein